MKQYAVLLAYYDKQIALIQKLLTQVEGLDLTLFANRYVFAMKVQQFYTAIEDLLKQIAKSFENHIEELSSYHKELLIRLNTEIPNIRPAVISDQSLRTLDKLRAFRHFVHHAYDVELDEGELKLIQTLLIAKYPLVQEDFSQFRSYIEELARY